jgi:branched-chain amino acid transport system ATP-binding protein
MVSALPEGPAIGAYDIKVAFGELEVVHGITLEIERGEFVGLLGANGAGKTTLLQAIVGVVPITEGEIKIAGDLCTKPLHVRARLGIAYVGDDRHVIPGLTVQQNLRLVGTDDTGSYSRFPELKELRHRRAGLLSGGEQQMLALARCLASAPSAILVDELSLGLAPMVRHRLLKMLKEIAADGIGVLVVEQSVQDVLEVADRVVVMRRGEIIDERPARDWHGDLEAIGALYLS